MMQEIIVRPKEKEIEVIPYWKRRSFWVIREIMNQTEADRAWKPGKAFDVIAGILFGLFIIGLTFVTSI